MEAQQYIEINPKVMMGKPVIKGTRITVELILEKLSEGETIQDILIAHPQISQEAIYAALAYAASKMKSNDAFKESTYHKTITILWNKLHLYLYLKTDLI